LRGGEVKLDRDDLQKNKRKDMHKEMKKVSKKLERLRRAESNLHQAHCSAHDAYAKLDHVRGMKKIADRAYALYAEAEEFHAIVSRKIKEIEGK